MKTVEHYKTGTISRLSDDEAAEFVRAKKGIYCSKSKFKAAKKKAEKNNDGV